MYWYCVPHQYTLYVYCEIICMQHIGAWVRWYTIYRTLPTGPCMLHLCGRSSQQQMASFLIIMRRMSMGLILGGLFDDDNRTRSEPTAVQLWLLWTLVLVVADGIKRAATDTRRSSELVLFCR